MLPPAVSLILGLIIITAAVYAVARKIDVRLALLLAALALGLVAGKPMDIIRVFLATFSDSKYIVPICSAMGFAYVLRHTGCDQHLVHLLVEPLRHARTFLIPGAVLVGFAVNIPIISQTSTAVAIGPVLIPLMLAAGISPITAGAALLLGSSIGGELLNPGAPEYSTIVKEMEKIGMPITRTSCVEHMWRLDFLHLAVATIIFWFLSLRAEAAYHAKTLIGADADKRSTVPSSGVAAAMTTGATEESSALPVEAQAQPFKVNLFKAAVPLVPLALLFITGEPLKLKPLPIELLVSERELEGLTAVAAVKRQQELFDSRLIGAAMLVGVAVAALTMLSSQASRKTALDTARAFFDGAGYAFAEIVAIIVAATCFAEGVKLIGLGELIGQLVSAAPTLLLSAAAFLPLSFAVVCGSGFASTQGLYGFFAGPALAQGIDPAHVGALVSLGAAAGRTMSPVAAVTLMSARLTGTSPAELVKRVLPPLLAGIIVTLIYAALTAPPAVLPAK